MAAETKAARRERIEQAVAEVIARGAEGEFGKGGYPLVRVIEKALDDRSVGADEVHEAADAVWEREEDKAAATEKAEHDMRGGAPGGGALAAGTEARPTDPKRREAIERATREIMAEGGPFERGAPALWAVRAKSGHPASKAEAAAAYEAVAKRPWPWPPTVAEAKRAAAAGGAHYPAALYHPEKPSRTVADAAAEEAARREGWRRPEDLPPEQWVAAWARETGADAAAQEAALRSVKRDRARKTA